MLYLCISHSCLTVKEKSADFVLNKKSPLKTQTVLMTLGINPNGKRK